MRTWGRVPDGSGGLKWIEIATGANGSNEEVYLTALCQVLKLNLLESPFYANYGIPQYPTVITQVFPDYYVMQIQQQYAQFFATLSISPVPNSSAPAYNIRAVTKFGTTLSAEIAT